MTDIADIFRQASERRVELIGWIGEHPRDGRDIAHLLLYPVGHGVADEMRVLAGLLGLRSAGGAAPAAVAPDSARVEAADDSIRVLCGDGVIAERPVTAEWIAAARGRQRMVLTLGMDGYNGRPEDLDRYLSRAGRLYYGLVAVRAGETEAHAESSPENPRA